MPKKIVIVPDVCNGKPVFEGTRITAASVVGFLAAGDTVADVVEAYPALSEADVYEALSFARRLMDGSFSLRSVG